MFYCLYDLYQYFVQLKIKFIVDKQSGAFKMKNKNIKKNYNENKKDVYSCEIM